MREAMKNRKSIFLTVEDMARFRDVLATASHYAVADDGLEQLKAQIKASVVESAEYVPGDVVTMGSRIRVREQDKTSEYRLCFPGDCLADESALSILDPLGAALLGARSGETVLVSRGSVGTEVVVDQVVYQQIDLELS